MEKLSASNRPHLVARAFCAGILKAGTTVVLIIAIFLRMPNAAYARPVRAKLRRRDDEIPELVAEVGRRSWPVG